ncbi:adenylate kinase [Emticicia sp. C21]|uniref:adenylate kinase n=1 Tax=Emticicia sp. C21 TaxID=2302915 RepID=UPI000E353197|nr:adenylate kinase [Emticicia sp. C21]RFS18380.1 adenylate kinase [Emticicia sp. C21]
MKLHILGASCSGVTTLGQVLANHLQIPYFDSDEYFWEKANPPFTTRRNPALRNEMLMADISQYDSWVIGGSLLKWDLELHFDLIVFLYIPHEIRMERLRKRELERYGDVIFSDPVRHKQYLDFMEWARGYDDNTTQGRTLRAHESWLSRQTCSVLEIRGDYSVEERMRVILQTLTSQKSVSGAQNPIGR